MDFWTPEQWSFASDMFNEEFQEELYFGRTPKGLVMSMLEIGKPFEEIAEETGYSIEKIKELHELMLYEKSKQQ